MLGYVYVMSNEAMPGLYKVGYTYRSPSERANELYTTGVPKPFIVEYCIFIEDCALIEAVAHINLHEYRYGKEFFKCDLVKCIIELKRSTHSQPTYREWYRDQLLRARVEGREAQYLQELEEKRRREQIAREERERRERQEAEALRAERERQKREKQDRLERAIQIVWGGALILMYLLALSDR